MHLTTLRKESQLFRQCYVYVPTRVSQLLLVIIESLIYFNSIRPKQK